MSEYHSRADGACLENEKSSPGDKSNLQGMSRQQHIDPSSPRLATGFSGIKLNEDTSIAVQGSQYQIHDLARASPQNNFRKGNELKSQSRMTKHVEQISSLELSSILDNIGHSKVLLLDLRSAAQHKSSRIGHAINIGIPPILLKRPMYTIDKMAENLTTSDRIKLEAWSATSYVILYDADSFNIGQGTNLYQIASKFVTDNGLTKVMLVKGGFNAVLREAAHLVDAHEIEVARPHSSSDNGSSETPLRAFGGLARTDVAHSQPVNPFYNNIRQNQDLIGGVGEPIPLQIPLLFSKYRHRIPKWLRDLVEDPNGARYIADKFLKIEEEEQKRMQSVLDAGANEQEGTDQVRHSVAAGVERGDKNRYNNIWPFENARVRLKVDKHNQCDYINASHLHVPNSDKFYIATQGPLPGTTKDFWRMIWDNKIRTIVMLTRTVEGGQTKCHKYWDQAESIQPYDLRLLDENEVLGDDPAGTKMSFTTRKFLLRDMSENSNGSREVTQIQFADWPDFHIIQPEVILALIAEVQKAELPEDTPATKRYKSIGSHAISDITVPVLSHCSAGCGRTGVFCTVDTVINLLKKQLEPPIVNSDHTVDLVEATVRNFRDQRISMVQTYDPASSIRYTS